MRVVIQVFEHDKVLEVRELLFVLQYYWDHAPRVGDQILIITPAYMYCDDCQKGKGLKKRMEGTVIRVLWVPESLKDEDPTIRVDVKVPKREKT